MKRAVFVFASIFISLLASSNQYAKEPAKKAAAPKETVPLITEVMTKEELQVYLKEKGIPIVTKENFRKPELVWEKTFPDYPDTMHGISDMTDRGNTIIVTRSDNKGEQFRTIYFLDRKAEIRNKIDIGKRHPMYFAVARGGKAVVVGDYNASYKFSYYNEEGKRLWKKELTMWNEFERIVLADNGEAMAITEQNYRWNHEEHSVGVDLNITKALFLNKKGKKIYEYKNIRNVEWGEFSDDGKYYAGLFCRQKNFDVTSRLVFLNVQEGKILWERPFEGCASGQFNKDYDLAVSEHGEYVAAVDYSPSYKAPKDTDPFDHYQIVAFDKAGKVVSRIRDARIYKISEEGFVFSGGGKLKQVADVMQLKALFRDKEYKPITAYRPDPIFPGTKSLRVIDQDAMIEDVNFVKYLVYKRGLHHDKGFQRIENFSGGLLSEIHTGFTRFTVSGKYMKVLAPGRTIQFYTLN